MKRRTKPTGDAAKFDLFPFLAVLLCTMGSLILMLVVIARHAQINDQKRQQAAREVHEDLEGKLASAEWVTEQLKTSRDKTQQQLAEQRAELSHLEDHYRRLRDELEKCDATIAELERTKDDGNTRTEELRDELARIEAKIRTQKEQLDKAREKAQQEKPSFSIVPYEGPNQTHRRPIYIECLSDRVVIQPEGVVLVESDFMGIMGASNALAASMRAVREYVSRFPSGRGSEGEPYPLLLVRPDGIGAYYAAREALTSWGSEFGYEFIERDWELDFPIADPRLGHELARAVEQARQRQVLLARAAPGLLSPEERMRFGSMTGGGGGGGLPGGAGGNGMQPGQGVGPGGHSDAAPNPYGNIAGPGGAGPGQQPLYGMYDGTGSTNNGRTETGHAGNGPGGNGLGNNPYGGNYPAGGNGLTGYGDSHSGGQHSGGQHSGGQHSGGQHSGDPHGNSSVPSGTGAGNGDGLYAASGMSGTPGQANPGSGGTYSGANGNGPPGNGAGNYAAGGQYANQGTQSGTYNGAPGGSAQGSGTPSSGGNQASPSNNQGQYASGSAGGRGSASSSGSGSSGGAGSTGSSGSGTSGSASLASSGNSGGGPTGLSSPNLNVTLGQQPQQAAAQNQDQTRPRLTSLAQTRGSGWALPEDMEHGPVPLTRLIRIDCYGDRLVLHRGDRSERVIPLGAHTQDAVDDLVGQIQQEITSWGIAGRNMGWRPELVMGVSPDGQQRYADLCALLAGSGLQMGETTNILPPALPPRTAQR